MLAITQTNDDINQLAAQNQHLLAVTRRSEERERLAIVKGQCLERENAEQSGILRDLNARLGEKSLHDNTQKPEKESLVVIPTDLGWVQGSASTDLSPDLSSSKSQSNKYQLHESRHKQYLLFESILVCVGSGAEISN